MECHIETPHMRYSDRIPCLSDILQIAMTLLIKKTPDLPLDQCKKICTYESLFDVLHNEHRTDHIKGDGLYKRIREYWENKPRHYCKLFSKTCPICLEKGQTIKKPVSVTSPFSHQGSGSAGNSISLTCRVAPTRDSSTSATTTITGPSWGGHKLL